MRIILDTDFGDDIDDSFALYYLLKAMPESISLVLSDFGQTEKRAELICNFLERCGRKDIPVGIGVNMEYRDPYIYKFFNKYELSSYPQVYENGLMKAKELIEENDDVVIIAIGPTTNLAALSEICEKAKDVPVYAMLGSVYSGYFGADKPDKEWNVFADVAATKKTLAFYKNLIIAPLDTCSLLQIEGESFNKFMSSATPVADDYKNWLTLGYHKDTDKTSVLYDTQPVYMVSDNSLLEYETLPLICDDEGFFHVDEKGNNVKCALRWKDKEAYMDMLSKVYI